MGSSSGSGSFVFGGSLSSSTLSPLAPPFNFDKTSQKPNLTNPSVNLFEGPVYSSVFDPAGPFWNSSSSPPPASAPSYVVPESTGVNTSCPTSPGVYGYQVPSYPDPVVTGDPFSYTQFQNSVSSNVGEGEKHYYPSYVYPPNGKDGYVGLGGVKGSGYDLLSNSGSGYCTGFGSSSVGNTQGLSIDGDVKPKWGDLRTGVKDGEHGEWKQYVQGFGSNGSGFSGLSGSKSHFNVDESSQVHPFSETSNECLLKQGPRTSQGLDCRQNFSPDSSGFYDIFGGGYPALSLGLGQQNYQSAFDSKLCGISAESSKLPAFASVPTSEENPHLQKPVLESITSFCGPRTTIAIDDHSIQTGSFVFSCSSATNSPITKSKLLYGGSKFTTPTTLSGTKVSHSDVVQKTLPVTTGCGSSSQNEPQVMKSRPSIVIKRPHSSLTEPSSTRIGETGNRSVTKDASDETKPKLVVPCQVNLDGFAREVGVSEVIFSAEKHTGDNDVRNPAEDSPCWKGASSTRFSPFGVSDPNTRETQCKTFHSIDLSSEEMNEHFSGRRPFSDGTLKDHEGSSLMSQKPHCFDLNNGAEINYVNEDQVSNEKSELAKLVAISLATQQVLERGEPSAEAEKSNNCTSTEAYTSFVIGNGLRISSSGDKSSFKLCQSSRKVSDSKFDVNMGLETMMNISEELKAYCLNSPGAVMQKHSKTIRHIIDNLSNCIPTIDAPKPHVSQMVNTAEAVTAAVKLSRRTEDFLESFLFKDDPIISGNDDMAEAIKKVLLENIQEEETDQHKVLYKNLWVEAEAALCAMTVKARLHHMKIEMEKACATTKEMGKSQSSSISTESTSKDKDSPALVVSDCSSLRTTTASKGECEASIINKFHVPDSQVSLNNCNKYRGLQPSRRETHVPDDSGIITDANDFATSVTARYQILKDRIDPSDSHDYDGLLSQVEEDNCLLEKDNSSLENSHSNVVEPSILTRYHILKSRDENSDSLNQSSEEFHLPDNVFSDTDKLFQNPHLINSFGGTDDVESSVMGRFRILQNQMNCLNATVYKDPTLDGSRMPSANVGTTAQVFFGPYPDFDAYMNKEATPSEAFKVNNLSSKIVEGWYDNGCSSSEWEHVSKEDLQRQQQ